MQSISLIKAAFNLSDKPVFLFSYFIMNGYDENDYYKDNNSGSRLSRIFDPAIAVMDWLTSLYMRKFIKFPAGKVADIGAGVGRLLYYLKKYGYEVYGTSISKTACRVSKERYGIILSYNSDIPEEWPAEEFEAVSYWHVFEHLENPEGHLKSVSRILKPDGLIFIEIPNPESVGAGLSKNAWLGSDPAFHINILSYNEVKKLLHEYGFRIIYKNNFSIKFSFLFIWSGLIGFVAPKSCDFNFIFDLFKRPMASVKKKPILTAICYISILVLSPAVFFMLCYGLSRNKGEIIRLVACKLRK